jgi:hypothetical protein
MGFKIIRALLIDALRRGLYEYELRADMRTKNLLWAGEVTAEQVIRLLLRCDGTRYHTSRHHLRPSEWCHVFTPEMDGEQWYIKASLPAAGVIFISVHR